jgi:hypothetical protein
MKTIKCEANKGSKFAAFVEALERLCRAHAVTLSASGYDGLQVWDAVGNDTPINFPGIDDMTKTTPRLSPEHLAALNLKDAEISRLREALQAMVDCSHTMDVQCCARASQLAASALLPASAVLGACCVGGKHTAYVPDLCQNR